MNGHVTAWLSAYYDGELNGPRLRQVEEHLRVCPACQAELEELHKLSTMLQAAPAPEPRLSPGRFQAQVMLRLPPVDRRTGWERALKTGWQFAPLGAVLAWGFGQAVWLLTSLISVTSLPLGLGRTAALGGWLNLGSAAPGWGGLGNFLELGVLNLVFSALVALFLCGWLASWWALTRQRSQSRGTAEERLSPVTGDARRAPTAEDG